MDGRYGENEDLKYPEVTYRGTGAISPGLSSAHSYPSRNCPTCRPKKPSRGGFAHLVNDQAGSYERYRKSPEELKDLKRGIRKFYEKQNSILDRFREVDELLSSPSIQVRTDHNGIINGESEPLLPIHVQADKNEASKVLLAILVNFVINVVLLGGKAMVAILSNSISLIASLVDSAMDFLSTVIIYGANRAVHDDHWKSAYLYPTGKRRMEPIGIVIFSVCMIVSFVQVFIESIQRLLDPSLDVVTVPLAGILVMLGTILLKGIVWFWSKGSKNSSIQALAQDAENDCVFNSFSLVFPYMGQRLGLWWLDPLGGMALSVYIIYEWARTLLSHVYNLSGRRAPPEDHQRVAYLVTRFSPLVEAMQHCHVYQSGDEVIVEVDIIVSPTTPLPVAHNVGESVQYALECLTGVSRAYCHVDFRSTGPRGHVQR